MKRRTFGASSPGAGGKPGRAPRGSRRGAALDQVIIVDQAAFGDDAAPDERTSNLSFARAVEGRGAGHGGAGAGLSRARLEAAGSVPLDPGHDFFSASELGVASSFETPMRVHGQSRWLLEHCLRQQGVAAAKLTMRSGVTVRGW